MRLNVLHPSLVEDGIAQQFIQARARQHLADDVKDAIGAECLTHLVEFLEKAVEDLALAGIAGDEIPDVHLVVLPVAVDASHPLLQAVGIPGDVVVDHQRAELQVDALTRGLGRHHNLRPVAEGVFGLDAGVHIQRTVDGHHVVTPLAQFAQRVLSLAGPGQILQRVLELGEDQQLARPKVVQDVVAQCGQLALDGLSAHGFRLGDERLQFIDLLAHLFDVLRDGQVFQPGFDVHPLILRQVVDFLRREVARPKIVFLLLLNLLRQGQQLFQPRLTSL